MLWFVLGCGGMLLFLCCGGAGVGGYFGYRAVAAEKPGIDAELTAFFQDVAKKDYDSAYNHFSTNVQAQQTKEQFTAILQSPFWNTFETYDSYQTTGFRIFFGTSPMPGLPAGTTAAVSGTLRYKNGSTGTFNAVMQKQGEQWRIYSINGNAALPAK